MENFGAGGGNRTRVISLEGKRVNSDWAFFINHLNRRYLRFCRSIVGFKILERAAGIEPASSAWKAEVLPLHNARVRQIDDVSPTILTVAMLVR